MQSNQILNISKPDFSSAGINAYEFHKFLKMFGYDSKLLNQFNNYNIEDCPSLYSWFYYRYVLRFNNKFNKIIDHVYSGKYPKFKTDEKYIMQQLYEDKELDITSRMLKIIKTKPNIIIFHFIDGFINSKTIKNLYNKYECHFIWILQDMAPLTGGCHYSWDCTKYTQDCNQCPAILDTNFKEIAKNNLEIKWSNLENLPITIVTPSEVLYHQARSSRVFKNKKIVKILLPFDPDRFMSHDRLEAKKYFNLPQKKIILFISASSLNDERKGIRFLKPIFDELIKIDTTILQNVHLLISGHEGSEYFSSLPLPFTYVGYLDNYYEIPLAFAASNIFISTSIQDSGPSMINQALMSGIPVVSFNMGIAFDLVIDNITGYRVDINDFHGFASKLSELIKIIRADERTISTNCRNIALEFCSPQKVISEFSYLL